MPAIVTFRGRRRWRGSVMIDGNRIQKTFPDDSRESRSQAFLWEDAVKKEGINTATNMVCLTIFDWAEAYLDFAQSHYVKSTFKEKRSVFKWLFAFLKTADTTVESITTQTANAFLEHQNRKVKRSGYATNKIKKNLAAAWEWGDKYLDNFPRSKLNPFKRLDRYPEVRSPRYVPSEEDFWKVYDASTGCDQVMLLTLLHTAARRGEIFKLTWADIDFPGRCIRLWTRKRLGGSNECDLLPMTGELRDVLLQWYSDRRCKDSVNVFTWVDEKGTSHPYLKRIHVMKKLCERAGVIPFGFHAIRHLTATILYRKGYPVQTIQAILRHKSAGTTERYLHSLSLEQTRTALEEGISRVVQVNFSENTG